MGNSAGDYELDSDEELLGCVTSKDNVKSSLCTLGCEIKAAYFPLKNIKIFFNENKVSELHRNSENLIQLLFSKQYLAKHGQTAVIGALAKFLSRPTFSKSSSDSRRRILDITSRTLIGITKSRERTQDALKRSLDNIITILLIHAQTLDTIFINAALRDHKKYDEILKIFLGLTKTFLRFGSTDFLKLCFDHVIKLLEVSDVFLSCLSEPILNSNNRDLLSEYCRVASSVVSRQILIPGTTSASKIALFGPFIKQNLLDIETISQKTPLNILREPSLMLNILNELIPHLNEGWFYTFTEVVLPALINNRTQMSTVDLSNRFLNLLLTICSHAKNPSQNDSFVDLLLSCIDKNSRKDDILRYLQCLSCIPSSICKSELIIQLCIGLASKDLAPPLQALISECISKKVNFISSRLKEVKIFKTLSDWIISNMKSNDKDLRILPELVIAQIKDPHALEIIAFESNIGPNLCQSYMKLIRNTRASKFNTLDSKSDISYCDIVFGTDWIINILDLIKNGSHSFPVNKEELTECAYSDCELILNRKHYSKLLIHRPAQESFSKIIFRLLMLHSVGDLDINLKKMKAKGDQRFTLLIGDALVWILVEHRNLELQKELIHAIESHFVKKCKEADLNSLEMSLSFSRISQILSAGVGHFLSMSDVAEKIKPLKGVIDYEEDKYSVVSSKNPAFFLNKIFWMNFSVLAEVYQIVANDSGEDSQALQNLEKSVFHWIVILRHKIISLAYGGDLCVSLSTKLPVNIREIVKKYGSEHIREWIHNPSPFDYHGNLTCESSAAHREATISAVYILTQIHVGTVTSTFLTWIMDIVKGSVYNSITLNEMKIYEKSRGEGFSMAENSPQKSNHTNSKNIGAHKPKQVPNKKSGKVRELDIAEIIKKVNDCRSELLNAIECLTCVLESTKNMAIIYPDSLLEYEAYLHLLISITLEIIKNANTPTKENDAESCIKIIQDEILEKLLGKILSIPFNSSLNFERALLNSTLSMAKLPQPPVIPQFKSDCELVFNYIKENRCDTNSKFVVIFSFIKNLVEAITHQNLKNQGLLSLINLISDNLSTISSSLNPSPLLPLSEILSTLLDIIRYYPAVRDKIRDSLISLFTQTELYVEKDSDYELHFLPIISKYKQYKSLDDNVSEAVGIILKGLTDYYKCVRETCITLLMISNFSFVRHEMFEVYIWISRFDDESYVSTKSASIWDDYSETGHLTDSSLEKLLQLCLDGDSERMGSFHLALYEELSCEPHNIIRVTEKIFEKYTEIITEEEKIKKEIYNRPPQVIITQEEQAVLDNKIARFPLQRSNIASLVLCCSSLYTDIETQKCLFKNIFTTRALGDLDSNTRAGMLNAAVEVSINTLQENAKILLDEVSTYTNTTRINSEATLKYMNESFDIILASLAISQKDKEVSRSVIKKLVDSLPHYSKDAQLTVSECFSQLMSFETQEYRDYISDYTLEKLLSAKTPEEIHGLAHGLAGLLKTPKISFFFDREIVGKLKDALKENKINPKSRDAAVAAFGALSYFMNRLFEPVIIDIVPLILETLKDANKDLQQRVETTCVFIISRMTAHCIKLTLPRLLEDFHNKNWRIKVGIIDVMRNMAMQRPKNLGPSMQIVIPHLMEAMTDSHLKVKSAANKAFESFGKVVVNQDIQKLSPLIVKTLTNPSIGFDLVLEELLEISFVNYIDAPSLSLLMPIFIQAMRSNNVAVKRKAIIATGNISHLTDTSNIILYVDSLRSELTKAIVDPVPEIRMVASNSLGMLVAKVGENHFQGLIEEIEDSLKNFKSVADCSGTSQCLSRIFVSRNDENMKAVIHSVLKEIQSPNPKIRSSYITLLMYLVTYSGERFIPYVGNTIELIIKGFADESSYVREISVKIGEKLIERFIGNRKTRGMFISSIEGGIADEDWRIRENSLIVVRKIFEYNMTEKASTRIRDPAPLYSFIGEDNVVRIIMMCYIIRSDPHGSIRQLALGILRLLHNVNAYIMQHIKEFVKILVEFSVRYGQNMNDTARRCLEETVSEFSPQIMNQFLDAIFSNVKEGNTYVKRGAYSIFKSFLKNSDQVAIPRSIYVKCFDIIKHDILSEDENLRSAAVEAYYPLLNIIGSEANEWIISFMFHKSNKDKEDRILSVVSSIIHISKGMVYISFLDTLITQKLTESKVKALISATSAAKDYVPDQISGSLRIVCDALRDNPDLSGSLKEVLEIIIHNSDSQGIMIFSQILQDAILNDRKDKFLYLSLVKYACENENCRIQDEIIDIWLNILLQVTKSTCNLDDIWESLDALIKQINKDKIYTYVPKLLAYIQELDNTSLIESVFLVRETDKYIKIVIGILLRALVSGEQDDKLNASRAIILLLEYISGPIMRNVSIQVMGALIRCLSVKSESALRAKVLECMQILVRNNEHLASTFYPQMSRVLVKRVTEQDTREVHSIAGRCCLSLLEVKPRVKKFISELLDCYDSLEDEVSKEEYVFTMRNIHHYIITNHIDLDPDLVSRLCSFQIQY